MKNTINAFGGHVRKNGPVILGGMAITTGAAATVMGFRAGIRASYILDAYGREEGYVSLSETISATDTKTLLKLTGPEIVPVAVLSAMSIASVVGALYLQNRRNAALAGLYALTETSFREYRNKVTEQIGAKKEQKVVDSIRDDIMVKQPVNSDLVTRTGKGSTLCYDELSGRYFESDIESIRSAVNDANESMMGGANFLTLNELYSLLGLKGIELGRDLGWNVDNIIKLDMGSHIASNGQPCLVISFENSPHSDYY